MVPKVSKAVKFGSVRRRGGGNLEKEEMESGNLSIQYVVVSLGTLLTFIFDSRTSLTERDNTVSIHTE
jgi:hypothetical protein